MRNDVVVPTVSGPWPPLSTPRPVTACGIWRYRTVCHSRRSVVTGQTPVGKRAVSATPAHRVALVPSSCKVVGMEIPEGARKRLEGDAVVWLTTVTDAGAPAPYPVWFVVDGDDIVVFSEPSTRRVQNIDQRPLVSLHFNSDPHGGDVWVLTGRATTTPDVAPSSAPGYVDKYRRASNSTCRRRSQRSTPHTPRRSASGRSGS